MQIGECWAYREKALHDLTPVRQVEILQFGPPRSRKVRVRLLDGEYQGLDMWVPQIRLRVLWDNAAARHEVSGKVVDRHYFGEITHLIVEVPGMDKPLSVSETNDFGADDIPVGAPIRLGYDPDALVALAD